MDMELIISNKQKVVVFESIMKEKFNFALDYFIISVIITFVITFSFHLQ